MEWFSGPAGCTFIKKDKFWFIFAMLSQATAKTKLRLCLALFFFFSPATPQHTRESKFSTFQTKQKAGNQCPAQCKMTSMEDELNGRHYIPVLNLNSPLCQCYQSSVDEPPPHHLPSSFWIPPPTPQVDDIIYEQPLMSLL